MDRTGMTFEDIKKGCMHWVEKYALIAIDTYPKYVYTNEIKNDLVRDSLILCLEYQKEHDKMNNGILKYLVKRAMFWVCDKSK